MRWTVSLIMAVMVAACTGPTPEARPATGFVEVVDGRFVRDGEPYRFAGVNFWYGAYLASDSVGDIERLRAELDLLKSQGITNLRVLGSSEESTLRNSIEPTFRDQTDSYNEALLVGLDRLLAEMGERDMQAVIYLNNFWEWSGGMATYLSWTRDGEIVDMASPDHVWPQFALFSMQFYQDEAANALYRDYVEAVVTRVNTVTGQNYVDDPAIMAWQLANEPRAGYSVEPGMSDLEGFYDWIDGTAEFIQALDANHLVSSGNEGLAGCADHPPCFPRAHATDHIDYLTVHIWPFNWGWLDPGDMPGTIERSIANADAYLAQHVAWAREMGKPLVLEEFGLPRDGGEISPQSGTQFRDRFLAHVYGQIERDALSGGPLTGSNFWSWGGYGRAEHEDGLWRNGDRSYVGDPPQEPQGLNSVFDTDASTLAIMRAHAGALSVDG
jgi:mannan endo-1,4-beta-mannosidase